MSQYQDGIDITLKIASDLSAGRYKAVKLSAANTCAICSSQGEKGIGILQENRTGATTATAGRVRVLGSTKWIAGDTNITFGTPLTVDASGLADVAAASDYVWGVALEACGTANDIIECIIFPPVTIY